MLNDEALRDRLVAAGRARAADFTWARTAAATAAVYRDVAGVSELVATIVSHDQRDLLGDCLAALARDGVPALVCENVPDGSAELARSLGLPRATSTSGRARSRRTRTR